MEIERALQADHSDYMRLVASFLDEETAEKVRDELIRHMEAIFARADRVSCAGFGRWFETEAEFEAWKQTEWDPLVDERASLEVERRPDGKVHVMGDYGLILDDWARDEVGIALDGPIVALRTYTAGYGVEYLAKWLSERGGQVDVQVEGCEYEFVPFDMALEALQAQAHAPGPGGVRAEDGDSHPAEPGGDRGNPGKAGPV